MSAELEILNKTTLAAHRRAGTSVVDLRDAVTFGLGHLAGSVHVKAKSPDFADRVQRFTPEDKPVILVADEVDEAASAAIELLGRRAVIGMVLANQLDEIEQPLAQLKALTPEQLHLKAAESFGSQGIRAKGLTMASRSPATLTRRLVKPSRTSRRLLKKLMPR